MQTGDALAIDYGLFADEEAYLFSIVKERYARQGWLGALDVMTIANWKASRARIHFARRIIAKSGQSLEVGARALTRAIAAAVSDAMRFRVVCGEWGFPLPTGSALLTVLYPDSFTVFDVRACDELRAYHSLGARTRVASLWEGYLEYAAAVRAAAPAGLTLRQADHWLWGRSRHRDLEMLVRTIGDGHQLRRTPT